MGDERWEMDSDASLGRIWIDLSTAGPSHSAISRSRASNARRDSNTGRYTLLRTIIRAAIGTVLYLSSSICRPEINLSMIAKLETDMHPTPHPSSE